MRMLEISCKQSAKLTVPTQPFGVCPSNPDGRTIAPILFLFLMFQILGSLFLIIASASSYPQLRLGPLSPKGIFYPCALTPLRLFDELFPICSRRTTMAHFHTERAVHIFFFEGEKKLQFIYGNRNSVCTYMNC